MLQDVLDKYKDVVGDVSADEWLATPRNVMYEKDGNYILFTYDYPGVYTGHWFFEVRGRAALNLAHELIGRFFKETGAKALRGLIKTRLRHSRWAARQSGFTSYGIYEADTGEDYELFIMTRKEYEDG